MLNWLSTRIARKRNAHNLYGSIVARSRAPALYTGIGVPDTLEGRFEILVLHMFVYLERLGGPDREARVLAQDIVNMFFADMDTTSRELGVGDLAVPKRMRGLAGAFKERMATYRQAARRKDRNAFASALRQTVFNETEGSARDASQLAGYVWRLRGDLSKIPIEDLQTGRMFATADDRGAS